MPFPPSAACRFFDLPPVNLQNLPLHLTKNSFASAPTHLCGIALILLIYRFQRGGIPRAIRSGVHEGTQASQPMAAHGTLLAAVSAADPCGHLHFHFQLPAVVRHPDRLPQLFSAQGLLGFRVGGLEIL